MILQCFVKVYRNNFIVLVFTLKLLSEFFMPVKCRQVIQNNEENIADVVKQLSDINVDVTDDAGPPPCLLDIQQDLPKRNAPQPLYIIPDTNQFWLPNARGQLQVPRGALIELYCSKSFANATSAKNNNNNNNNNNSTATFNNTTNSRNFTNNLQVAKNTKTLRPRCLHNKTFLWPNEKHELQQFICEQSPKYTVEQLHDKCPTMTDDRASVSAQMYRVGFNISGNRFLETMRICFDDTVLRTLYVQHKLLPASIHFQKFIKRLNFSKAGYFRDVNMNYLYTQQSQRQRAAELLKGQHEHLFDNRTLFLARGHLAAKSDFIYGNQQRATFNFFNAAPQWQSFNAGQWAALEHEVRQFVARSKLLVECYTGTVGTLQLPYKIGEPEMVNRSLSPSSSSPSSSSTANLQYRDFFLARDNNNNGLLPVPQLFYRILIDRSHQVWRGIALIGVNNPHATLSEIHASYIICEDIQHQVTWLRWIQNKNLKRGFLYACRVPDFVAAVGSLPKSLLNVTELLI